MKTAWVGERLDAEEARYHGLDARRGPWRVVTRFLTEDFVGVLVEDDDGAALCWNDFVANNWVELFSATPVALVRLALLLDAGGREAFFAENATDFHKPTFEFLYTHAPGVIQ